jgi:hypothetical protein
MYRCISAYPFITVLSLLLLALSFYSYTCWVLTISVLNLTIFPCYSNLLLRRRGWTAILRQGVLGYVLPQLSFLLCYGVFHYFVPLRIIIVFRDTIYVIIILYSWYLVICEHFWPYVWNNWSWVMHTMNTWLWHKNWVWEPPVRVPPLECTAVPDLEPRRHQRRLSGELAPRASFLQPKVPSPIPSSSWPTGTTSDHHQPLRATLRCRNATTASSLHHLTGVRPHRWVVPPFFLPGVLLSPSLCPCHWPRHKGAVGEPSPPVTPHRLWPRWLRPATPVRVPRTLHRWATTTAGPGRQMGHRSMASNYHSGPPTHTHRDLGPKAGPQAKNDFSFSKIL